MIPIRARRIPPTILNLTSWFVMELFWFLEYDNNRTKLFFFYQQLNAVPLVHQVFIRQLLSFIVLFYRKSIVCVSHQNWKLPFMCPKNTHVYYPTYSFWIFGNRQPWVIFYFVGFPKRIWLSNLIFHWDLRTDWVQNCQHHQNWTVGDCVRISFPNIFTKTSLLNIYL